MDNEVYVLTIHDEDTFQILGIYSDYLKADEDRRGYIKYNNNFYFRADLRITLMKLNELYSFEKFRDSEVK